MIVEEAAVNVVAQFTGEVKEAEWLAHEAGGCERPGALGGSWGVLDDGWEWIYDLLVRRSSVMIGPILARGLEE